MSRVSCNHSVRTCLYLKNFNQMTKCCYFDKIKECGGDFQYVEDTKTSGFCSHGEYGWVAIYPENKSLVVQIKGKKWDLLDDGLEVDYFHIYDKKLTSFCMEAYYPLGRVRLVRLFLESNLSDDKELFSCYGRFANLVEGVEV